MQLPAFMCVGIIVSLQYSYYAIDATLISLNSFIVVLSTDL